MTKAKILFFATNPPDTRWIALDEELRTVKKQLEGSSTFEIVEVLAARPDDWLQALNTPHLRMVHFSGHGTKGGALLHVGDDGLAQSVSRDALKAIFQRLKGEARLVIFTACYSELQALAITEEVDCVIGMNDAINDKAAITFIRTLYQQLLDGKSVEDAFEQGKIALLLGGLQAESVPKLLVRSGVDAKEVRLTGASSAEKAGAIPLFYCYAPDDEEFCKGLDLHLVVMRRQGLITNSHYQNMLAGDLTPEKMQQELDAANIILLIVSPSFLADDSIYEKQLKQALTKREQEKACVIPIIVRPTDGLENMDFGNLFALPRDKKPVSAWKHRDEALFSIATDIRKVVEAMHKERKR